MNFSSKSKYMRFFISYMFSFGLLSHFILLFILFSVLKSFLHSGPTFAKASLSMGAKIQRDYPSIKPLGSLITTIGNQFNSQDYFWNDFNANYWPTVGPRDIGFFKTYIPRDIEQIVYVNNNQDLSNALANAIPGSVIVISDGSYHLTGKKISISRHEPTKDEPIYLVAEHAGQVDLNLDSVEGLYINKPYWNIIGINFIGTCQSQSKCNHAFHVVGDADNFYAAHNTFVDFSAAIKVNRLKGDFPDNGTIEYNHFYFTQPRAVKESVTPINMDHGNQWTVSHNIIRDFSKVGGNKIAYGVFFKGGAVGGVISNNLVICNSHPEPTNSVLVGISIGGGGMGQGDRRDKSDYEAKNIVVKNNIVMHCNDVGLYVNKGQDSEIYNNIFYNTSGIDLRFPATSGYVYNNVLNGDIRYRDGGTGILDSNSVIKLDYWTGHNGFQDIYHAPSIGNFFLIDSSLLNPSLHTQDLDQNERDFCGKPITQNANIGAVQESSYCFGDASL